MRHSVKGNSLRGCISFFCAACLLGEGGRVEPTGGTLAKRKGVVHTVKERESKMQPEDLQQRWKEQGEEATAAIAQWRMAHPRATLAEIEQAIDLVAQPVGNRGADPAVPMLSFPRC